MKREKPIRDREPVETRSTDDLKEEARKLGRSSATPAVVERCLAVRAELEKRARRG